MEEEIPTPGLTVTFLVRIEDVTSQILDSIKIAKTEDERDIIANRVGNIISDKATTGTQYSAQVKNFFGGNNYYMLVYETYKDIRMVGAPPSSIGKFGADTDNWMWPRHTGDFSLFRIYADKNGKPAQYSKDNVPLKPKYHLPISIKGVKKNDFAMIEALIKKTQEEETAKREEEENQRYSASLYQQQQATQNLASQQQGTNWYFYNTATLGIGASEFQMLWGKRKLEDNWRRKNKGMSSIAGSTSILVAAEYLSNLHSGKGVMLGGITGISPTEVVIIGADTAGEYAARAALGLGAAVKIFDQSLQRLTDIQNRLGTRLYTSIFHPQVIEKALRSADVVIGSPVAEEDAFAQQIPTSFIEKMKKGAVIIDLTISNGGSFETSECCTFDNPSFTRHAQQAILTSRAISNR